jgi:hypothetical protein
LHLHLPALSQCSISDLPIQLASGESGISAIVYDRHPHSAIKCCANSHRRSPPSEANDAASLTLPTTANTAAIIHVFMWKDHNGQIRVRDLEDTNLPFTDIINAD